jgi:hypothetical protein
MKELLNRKKSIERKTKEEAIRRAEDIIWKIEKKSAHSISLSIEYAIGDTIQHRWTNLWYLVIWYDYVESRGIRYITIPVCTEEKTERYYFYPIEIKK